MQTFTKLLSTGARPRTITFKQERLCHKSLCKISKCNRCTYGKGGCGTGLHAAWVQPYCIQCQCHGRSRWHCGCHSPLPHSPHSGCTSGDSRSSCTVNTVPAHMDCTVGMLFPQTCCWLHLKDFIMWIWPDPLNMPFFIQLSLRLQSRHGMLVNPAGFHCVIMALQKSYIARNILMYTSLPLRQGTLE